MGFNIPYTDKKRVVIIACGFVGRTSRGLPRPRKTS